MDLVELQGRWETHIQAFGYTAINTPLFGALSIQYGSTRKDTHGIDKYISQPTQKKPLISESHALVWIRLSHPHVFIFMTVYRFHLSLFRRNWCCSFPSFFLCSWAYTYFNGVLRINKHQKRRSKLRRKMMAATKRSILREDLTWLRRLPRSRATQILLRKQKPKKKVAFINNIKIFLTCMVCFIDL